GAWSCRLLEGRGRGVFRYRWVFRGRFTLEGAEAVGGGGAAVVVVRLVECSLLSPPRAGPDGRARYLMLETLRAYGAARLAGAGGPGQGTAAVAGHGVAVGPAGGRGVAAGA